MMISRQSFVNQWHICWSDSAPYCVTTSYTCTLRPTHTPASFLPPPADLDPSVRRLGVTSDANQPPPPPHTIIIPHGQSVAPLWLVGSLPCHQSAVRKEKRPGCKQQRFVCCLLLHHHRLSLCRERGTPESYGATHKPQILYEFTAGWHNIRQASRQKDTRPWILNSHALLTTFSQF